MKLMLGLVAMLFIVLPQAPVLAAGDKDEPQVFATRAGAIRGYDPVAYFTQQAAVKGDKAITYEWNGAVWRFASEDNRTAFAADPGAFAPQYGGWCAYAMSRGERAATDPKAWSIHDGKLYLNYSKSIRKRWLKDIPGYVEQADRHWRALLAQSGVDAT